jgi:hypothetical protein
MHIALTDQDADALAATEPPPFIVNDSSWLEQTAASYADEPIAYHLPEHCIPALCQECQPEEA